MTILEKTETPILFDDFQPGRPLGRCELSYDEALVQRWQRIFGDGRVQPGGRAQAASVATILLMRAYMEVVAPRPPGNIHARQSIGFAQLPRPGERLVFHFECRSKEMRRGRRYVELHARAESPDGIRMLEGVLTLIWAA